MKMKDVIAQTGLPENTIRYYETRGLLRPRTERRNGRTYHDFSPEDVAALKHIIVLRQAQFSIEEILTMQHHPERLPELAAAGGLSQAQSWQEAAGLVSAAMRRDPGYTPQFHFAQDDPVLPGLSVNRQRFFTKNTVIAMLGLLCAVLLGLTLTLFTRQIQEIPAAGESTEGWLYYKAADGLYRRSADGSQEELVYPRALYGSHLGYLVDEDKVYVADTQALYSINADGSGKHKFQPKYLSSYGGDMGYGLFQLYEGGLYTYEYSSGGLGGGECCLVRISTQDGTVTKLRAEPSEEWVTWWGYIHDGMLYLVGNLEGEYTYPDAPEETVSTLADTELRVYDLSQDTLVQEVSLGFPTTVLDFDGTTACLCRDHQWEAATMEEFLAAPACSLWTLDLTTLETQCVRDKSTDYIFLWHGGYCVYSGDVVETGYDAYGYQNTYLENISTGQRTVLSLPRSEDCYYTFTGEGLLIVGSEAELVPYP